VDDKLIGWRYVRFDSLPLFEFPKGDSVSGSLGELKKFVSGLNEKLQEYEPFKSDLKKVLDNIPPDGGATHSQWKTLYEVDWFTNIGQDSSKPYSNKPFQAAIDRMCSDVADPVRCARAVKGAISHHLWDNVFSRDRSPIEKLINGKTGDNKKSVRTYGDFLDNWDLFLEKIMDYNEALDAEEVASVKNNSTEAAIGENESSAASQT
jgi:hypothetical protein